MPQPILKSDVLDIKDLKIGMKLQGTVRNVIDFGAFVDIGLHNDGLIHISQMSTEYIKHPSDLLSVGDIKFQEKSLNKMMELIKGGTTVLYVSHSLDSIKELCTRVVWIEHGKIVKVGNTEEICDEYYNKQMN